MVPRSSFLQHKFYKTTGRYCRNINLEKLLVVIPARPALECLNRGRESRFLKNLMYTNTSWHNKN